MADTYTGNLNLTLPEVGASQNSWGAKLNGDMTLVDAIFAAGGGGTSVGLNVGSTKTLAVAGALTITGTATAVTQATNDSSTKLATTALVTNKVTDYGPNKAGSGATGTWAISISGNATTATTANSATYAASAIVAGSSDTVIDGAITTVKIANSAVTLAKISATGTASQSTYLRGDGAWVAAPTMTAVTSIIAGNGLTGGTITSSGTIAVDVYTGSSAIEQTYAIGQTLWCETLSEVLINSTVVPKVSAGSSAPSTSGTYTIYGTWLAKGSKRVAIGLSEYGEWEFAYMTLIQRAS